MRRLWILCGLLSLTLILALACTSAPPPTPVPSAKATPNPTETKPSPSPTASPAPSTSAKPASPSAAAVSFAGKTVTVVVGVSPGGASDTAARLYARYLGRFLPGKPAVVVRNMPGGESTIAMNFAHGSKPDGLTLLLAGSTEEMASLLHKPGLKFNSLTEMTATVVFPPTGDVYVFKSGLFDKPEDIVKAKGITYGHTGGAITIMFIALKEAIGIPTDKVITAYGGGSDARRALLAGEISGSSESNLTFADTFGPYVQKGEFKVLCQTGMVDASGNLVKHPGFAPDILTGKELYEKVQGKAASGLAYEAYKAIVGSVRGMDKVLLLPPGTPDNIKHAYWAATEAMVKDAEFQKGADPIAGVGAKLPAGESFDKAFKKNFGLAPDVATWLKDTLSTKYGMVL
ncbi:MAG: hypothetical protein HYX90_03635 [Chloroflexi bacterium]|nr:hypothetical protein [Chloroflexota bacterium]